MFTTDLLFTSSTPASPADVAQPNDGGSSVLLAALWPSAELVHQFAIRPVAGKFSPLSYEGGIGALAGLSASKHDCYFACAEYATAGSRTAANATCASAFWMDFDCGDTKATDGKGYATEALAHAALDQFLTTTGIPVPSHVVRSGGGLHVYWAVTVPIPKADWQEHAAQLKALCKHHGLLADPSRTSDIASVLRVPGTLNWKYDPPRPVVLDVARAASDREALLVAIATAQARIVPEPEAHITRPDAGAPQILPPDAPPELGVLASALTVLDPDCDEATWKLHRLAPLARAAREHPALAVRLRDLARTWSSGELRGSPSQAWRTPGASNGSTGEEIFEREWNRFLTADFPGTPVTLGTIFHEAKAAGWEGRSALEQAKRLVSRVVAAAKAGDVGAPFGSDAIAALNVVASASQADYQRVRGDLKKAKISIGALEKMMKAEDGEPASARTHHGYAKDLISRLTIDGWAPVAHDGVLYVVDPGSKIWLRQELPHLERKVAEAYDGNENCIRVNDYRGIAGLAVTLAEDHTFFDQAPIGVACSGAFLRVSGESTERVPLSPSHRQRVMLEFDPREQDTPHFNRFLHETFKSDVAGEEEQQVALMQEVAGAIMLGLMARHQKAVLFYDPFGRAGKGTMERILRQLVPAQFVTAVSPFKWNEPYFLATLVGARLNVVGELPETQSIPAADFKTVIGGDLLTGRHPAGRPISFTNEAAHLFMSNHMISTKDQSEAFFARWLILEFPNSRLVSGERIEPLTADRIIDEELPGVAAWALQGAARLLRAGKFSASMAHDRLMQKWRQGNSSLQEFIHDECELVEAAFISRAAFYREYSAWCQENGRKAFAKSRVRELLAANVRLGLRETKLDGYDGYRGISLKADGAAALAATLSDVDVGF
jgi:P4 family phage/plasmid primase-like protien